MSEELKLGKYKHYKGKFYEVLFIGKNSETLELVVVYRALYDSEEFGNNQIWVRPLEMFKEKIILGGKEVPRFEFVE